MNKKFTSIANYPAPLRLGIFIIILGLIWLPIAAPIYLVISDANLVTILTMGLMFIQFLVLVNFWGKNVYQQPHLLQHYGLVWTRKNARNLIKGLAIGFSFCLGLFILEYICGWLNFNPVSSDILLIIFQGLFSGLGIGLAEELVFRGWLLDELNRDYHPNTVLIANAIAYALLHFIKPIDEIIRTFPTFPALIILGLTLVWAKRAYKSLGICIGIHGGLVWAYYIVNIGNLITYTDQISPYVTGIDGNPIAGLMGLFCLSILAFLMRLKYQKSTVKG